MIHKFYQVLKPLNQLIEVGEYDVPEGYSEWRVPVFEAFGIGTMESVLNNPPKFDNHIYYKKYIGFIADVEVKI